MWNIYRWYPPNGFMQYFAKEKLKLYFSIMCFLKSFITDQMDSAIFDCNRACNSVRNYISLVLTPFAYCLRSRWPFWVLTWTRFFRNPDWTLFIILRSLIYWVSEFSCFRANSYKLGLLSWDEIVEKWQDKGLILSFSWLILRMRNYALVTSNGI